MLFMLTPEIKTNLILKEIGIKRYSLRSKSTKSPQKSLHFYQKGHILALLDKPFENFIKQDQELIQAILSSTKLDNGAELYKTIIYSSINDLKKEIFEKYKIKLIIQFGNLSYDHMLDLELIEAPTRNQLTNNKESKKDLWHKIKEKLSL